MLEVVAVQVYCNLCDRSEVYIPGDQANALDPTAVPKGWVSFAERPLGRVDRHWCPECAAFVEKHKADAVAALRERRRGRRRRRTK